MSERNIEELIHKALEFQHEERDAFLRHACAGDDELLQKIHRLVEARERSRQTRPPTPAAPRQEAPPAVVEKRSNLVPVALTVCGIALAASAVMVWQWKQTRDSERAALAAADEASRHQEQTQSELTDAAALSDFLSQALVKSAMPGASVENVLEQAAATIEQQLQDRPLAEASARWVLGEASQRMGEAEVAERNLQRALDLRLTELGEDAAPTLQAFASLAGFLRAQERPSEALPFYEKLHTKLAATLGDDHEEVVTAKRGLLLTRHDLAVTHVRDEQFDQAESLLGATLEQQQELLGADHPHTLQTMETLAGFFEAKERDQDAAPLFENLLRVRREQLGEDDPRALQIAVSLARAKGRLGDTDAAIQLLESVLNSLPKDSPDSKLLEGQAQWWYGQFLQQKGNLPAAEKALLRGHAVASESPGKGSELEQSLVVSLIDLYEAMDDKRKLRRWKNRRVQEEPAKKS